MEAKELISLLHPFTIKKYSKAILILFFDLTLGILLTVAIIHTDGILSKIVFSILLGLVYTLLFVVGHDACHQSFTPSHRLNEWIGIISFCPTLHNFGLWRIGHNQTHHRYTNLKTHDYVYTPISREEYKLLTEFAKLKYRIYRTAPGHLFYYLIEIWWSKMTNPGPYMQSKQPVSRYWKYQIFVIIYFIFLLITLYAISDFKSTDFLLLFTFVFMIPFLTWNWLMGFAIYQHHTNLKTKWFSDIKDWDYWESQIENSVHIRFPRWINFILHNIMEHTAHHANMSIPLYNLYKAQKAVNRHLHDKIIVIDWSLSFYLKTLKECKLYNTHTHQWEKI